MLLLNGFVTYFENKMLDFEYFIEGKKPKIFFDFIIYPIVFVFLLFISFFVSVFKSIFPSKNENNSFFEKHIGSIIQESPKDENIDNNLHLPQNQTHSIFRKDTTTKYLYDVEFKEVDLEEKERTAKKFLEESRKQNNLDVIDREIVAGYEGIECNMFSMLTTEIPEAKTPLNKKMKERMESEKNFEKADVEELRQKLLAPNENRGGTSKQLQMEPYKGGK